MTPTHQSLWNKIKRFEIGDPNQEFSFIDRLARENGWKMEFALRVILEYKKFMFLICIADHPCTPSDQVDQVWHLHLLYTESYWEDFCEKTLNRKVHHGPTKGGSQERLKYNNLYELTKELYQKTFDVAPPQDIWPGSEIRFNQISFQRVNIQTHWILKKPTILNTLKWPYPKKKDQ